MNRPSSKIKIDIRKLTKEQIAALIEHFSGRNEIPVWLCRKEVLFVQPDGWMGHGTYDYAQTAPYLWYKPEFHTEITVTLSPIMPETIIKDGYEYKLVGPAKEGC